MTPTRDILLTGLPDGLALRWAEHVLATDPRVRIHALVRADHAPEARRTLARLSAGADRAFVRVGDVTSPDLQLAPEAREVVRQTVTEIVHMASCHHIGIDKLRVEQVNIDGTRHVLRFARSLPRLQRFHHLSTAFVAGDRRGVVLEDELEAGQHFRNTWERTRFVAELEVRRAMADLPVTVYRPSLIVGDSRNGRLDRYEGSHFLVPYAVKHPVRLIAMLPQSLRSPLHVVPIDYVVQAIAALSIRPESVGQTYHLVDPNPISLPHALRLVSEHSHQPALQDEVRAQIAGIARRFPALTRWRGSGLPTIDELNAPLVFNSMYADSALRRVDLRCPPLPTYIERLVAAVHHGDSGGPDRATAA